MNDIAMPEQSLETMSEQQLRREIAQALRQSGLFRDQDIAAITNRIVEWRHQNRLTVIE